jgi:hypothetical protein
MTKFLNGDTIELKAIKYAEFASEETHCFEANIYINGKLYCHVDNDGRGGSNRYDRCVQKLCERISKELPKWHSEWDDSWRETNLEIWCGDQVNMFLAKKEFAKAIRKSVLVVDPKEPKDVQAISFKGKPTITNRHIDYVVNKYSDHKVLNAMPKEEAFEVFYALT